MEVSTKLRGGFKWVKKGVTTHIKRGEEEETPWGWRTPWGCCPPSPIYWVVVLLSLMLVHLSLCPSSRCSTEKAWLRRSPAEIFSPPPPPSSCVVGVPGGSSTSAAQLEQGTEVVVKPDVWPSTEALPVCGAHLHDLEVGRVYSTPTTFVCGNVIPLPVFEGESFWNRYKYLLDMILACCKP